MKQFCVYIMASRKDGATYIGVTSNLAKRIYEHKHEIIKGHTSKYNIKKLVFFELHDSAESAITRETQIKTWKRAWKIELIEQENPHWDDLYNTII
ncbi:MAG: GIY-YIG nuclease family protein [Alphaproteobacteria bacterium]|nr:GIY-YIG nuclease family protein [Alphaproteobacteria bacterium]